MAVHNEDIAAIFDEIADLLEIEGDNPFRIRAYRNAARSLRGLTREVAGLVGHGEDLSRLPGICRNLAAKIEEVVATGRCQTLEKLRRRLPPTLGDLLHLPGLGPKRVRVLFHELDIHDREQLERAARDGLVARLPGFGERLQAALLEALTTQTDAPHRFKRVVAARLAEGLVALLEAMPGVDGVTIAGSFRRCRETVGDLDILVTARRGRDVVAGLVADDEVEKVLSQGRTRASVVLRSGLQVDLRVVPRRSYGAALHYFTGSRAHTIAIRGIARAAGLRINEYGVYRGRKRIAGETEAGVFAAVGLPWIPPELRENRGEIEAAREGLLPELVEHDDLRGDLHVHSRASDGRDDLEALARAAEARGLEYLAITDHSRRLTVAHGLDSQRLLAQMAAIDDFNTAGHGVTLLKGIEVEILEDGSLDLSEDLLRGLDIVIGAVHSHFHLSRARQTRRILRAMDHPCFTMLAHPTGRLIERRPPYDVDMGRLIHHARQRGCFLELNAHPDRLDLYDTHCRLARETGVLVAIDSDAHGVEDLDNLRFGIGQARRGWLEPRDVLNTRPLPELRRLLAKARG